MCSSFEAGEGGSYRVLSDFCQQPADTSKPLTPPQRYVTTAVEVDPERPVLVDKYLDRAIELDVDAIRDTQGNMVICGIMEHIEQVRV
jgi:hypothetical protein